MVSYPLSIITSFTALALIASSYFVRTKNLYLAFQWVGIVFLILSFLFSGNYFATIAESVALIRTLTYSVYEKKNKTAPLWFAFLFSFLAVSVYLVVNLMILKTAKTVDIIYAIALCLYAFAFRIRNLAIMRYVLILPVTLAIIYDILVSAPFFTTLAYASELIANLLAIVRHLIETRKKKSA